MRITWTFLSMVLALVGAASGQAPTSIEGTSWRLAKLSKLRDAELDQSPRAILRFDGGRLRGFSGCNRFTGTYSLAGGRVSVGNQTHTVNKCAAPALDVEDLLKLAFKANVRYSVADGRLALESENGITMDFEAQPAHALEGVQWEVTEFDDGAGKAAAPAEGTAMSLFFRYEGALPSAGPVHNEGAVVGNAGCNLFKAPYTLDGERLSIGQPVFTSKTCPGLAIMELERAFLAALAATKTWTFRGEDLELQLADGARGLSAQRAVQ